MTHTKSGVRTNGAHSLLKPCVNERKEMTLFSTGYRLHQYHNVFNVSKEMAKVNVEEIARCGHHDVIVMAITNALQWCIN